MEVQEAGDYQERGSSKMSAFGAVPASGSGIFLQSKCCRWANTGSIRSPSPCLPAATIGGKSHAFKGQEPTLCRRLELATTIYASGRGFVRGRMLEAFLRPWMLEEERGAIQARQLQ